MRALYNHTLSLIEPTKILERQICDTMTVTNVLQRAFEGTPPSKVTPSIDMRSDVKLSAQSEEVFLYSPITILEGASQIFQIPIYCVFGKVGLQTQDKYFNAQIQVTSPDGTSTVYPDDGTSLPQYDGPTEFNPNNFPTIQYRASQLGTYTIKTVYSYIGGYQIENPDVTVTYALEVQRATERPSSAPWTITDVVNRILSAGETRRVSLTGGTDIDPQRYVFSSELAEKFAKMRAPEFFFTRGTLRGALDIVGSYINGIPRLKGDYETIGFDDLTSDEKYSGTLPPAIHIDEQISGEEYAQSIDSPAQNILNTLDTTFGAIVEPSENAWRAVNCPRGEVTIAANTMTFPLEQPAYRISKLYLRWTKSGSALDATPYVYEAAEYDVLSGYEGEAYPYSRGWALRFEQGGSEITGLNFVVEGATGAAFQNYSIVNILQSLGVEDISNSSDFANNLFYRVEYIPVAELRVTQRKAFATHSGAGTLIYNQSGNTIESAFFGQKMKGTIARIGNKVKRRTYLFTKLADIPKVGQIYNPDGGQIYEKITNVDKEYHRRFVKATVTSTPEFNRIAEYVGVNSNYRLYDISEKQSVDRFVHYEEICVVNGIVGAAGNPMITTYGITEFSNTFSDTEYEAAGKVTAARITSHPGRTLEDAEEAEENQVFNTPITTTCSCFPFGNSLVFYVNMADNYGAGRQSTDGYYKPSDERRTSRTVPYADSLGNLSSMSVVLGSYVADNSNGFSYPDGTNIVIPGNNVYFETGSFPFFVSKDSREALHFTYQLHFVSGVSNVVIGRGLANNNGLVKNKIKATRWAWLNKTVDNVDPIVTSDMVIGLAIYEGAVSGTTVTLRSPRNETGQIAAACAIVTLKSGTTDEVEDVIVAQNVATANNAVGGTFRFQFIDNAAARRINDID